MNRFIYNFFSGGIAFSLLLFLKPIVDWFIKDYKKSLADLHK